MGLSPCMRIARHSQRCSLSSQVSSEALAVLFIYRNLRPGGKTWCGWRAVTSDSCWRAKIRAENGPRGGFLLARQKCPLEYVGKNCRVIGLE